MARLRLPGALARAFVRLLARGVDEGHERAPDGRNAVAGRAGDDERRLLRCALETGGLLLELLGRERIRFVERNDLGLFRESVAIGLELRAHGLVRRACVLPSAVDEMQQRAA